MATWNPGESKREGWRRPRRAGGDLWARGMALAVLGLAWLGPVPPLWAADADVVLNEVLANEPGGSTSREWVELYNAGSEPVDLGGWLFIDGTAPDTTVLPEGTEIDPFGYVLVCRDTTSFLDFWVERPLWGGLVEADMSLANGGDSVSVVDESGAVRGFRWTFDAGDSLSFQKLDPLGGDGAENWAASTNPLRNDPGAVNHSARFAVDGRIAAASVRAVPGFPGEGDSVRVEAAVLNEGSEPLAGGSLVFFWDEDGNGIQNPGEAFGSVVVPTLAPSDTFGAIEIWVAGEAGEHAVGAALDLAGDEEVADNWALVGIQVGGLGDAPEVSDTHWTPEEPTSLDSVVVMADVLAMELASAVTLYWAVDSGQEQALSMAMVSGDVGEGTWRGVVPPQPAGARVDLHVEAEDLVGQTGRDPGVGDYAYLVAEPPAGARIRLSELMANAPAPEGQLEYVELVNLDDTPGSLEGWTYEDGGALQRFPSGAVIPANGYLVMSPDTAAFRAFVDYDLPPGVSLVEMSISLSNAADSVTVREPGEQIAGAFGWSQDSGDTRPWEKIVLGAGDGIGNWAAGQPLGTPGRGNSVTPLEVDGAVPASLVRLDPGSPLPGDPVEVTARVVNEGREVLPAGSLSFAIDGGPPFADESTGPVAVGDTLEIGARWDSAEEGVHVLSVELQVDGDENSANDLAELSVAVGESEVILSEVMANAPAPEGDLEFVELANPGDTDALLEGWTLDGGSTPQPFPPATVVPAGGFLVVSSDTLAFRAFADYGDVSGTPLVQMGLALSNASDAVTLADPEGDLWATFAWESDAGADRSWEKIDPGQGDGAENWAPSQVFGSPGRRNTSTLYSRDAAVLADLIAIQPPVPRPGDDVEIMAWVSNAGRDLLDSLTVEFSVDGDVIETGAPQDLAPGDTLSVQATWPDASTGSHWLGVEVFAAGDENPENDRVTFELQVRDAALVITEVMANPAGGETELPGGKGDEYIEIVNLSDESIDMAGWSISDGDGLDMLVAWDPGVHGGLEAQDVQIETTEVPAGGYVLVLDPDYASPDRGEVPPPYTIGAGAVILTVEDSDLGGGGGLSAADPLTLYDGGGTTRAHVVDTYGTPLDVDDPLGRDDDELDELPRDPGDGYSMERVDPAQIDQESNWVVGPQGGTPGRRNTSTLYSRDAAVLADLIAIQPPVPRPGDDVEIMAWVSNAGRDLLDSLTVEFSVDGDVIETGAPQDLAPGDTLSVQATWPDASTGSHWLGVEVFAAGDENPENDRVTFELQVRDAALVITEVMANPAGGETELPGGKGDEYIEIVNLSDESIDMAGWSISDGDGLDMLVAWDPGVHGGLEAQDVQIETTEVPAGGYVLVLDPDYASPDRGEVPPPYTIGAGAVILTVEDSDLGGGGGLSAADPLTLYDGGGTTRAHVVDTYGTPLDVDDPLGRDDDELDELPRDPGDGYSMERVDPAQIDQESNWVVGPQGGTPGRQNAATPYEFDLAVSSSDIVVVTDPVVPGEAVTVQVTAANVGLRGVSDGRLVVRVLDTGDSLGIVGLGSMAPGETIVSPFVWDPYPGGSPVVEARLTSARDLNPANDVATRRFGFTIVLNEVMSNPEGAESSVPGGESDEWVELYNASADTFDLAGWMLSDGDGVDTLVAWGYGQLKDRDARIGSTLLLPGGYAMVLDRDYVYSGASQPYDLAPGTLVLAVADGNFASSGLATSEPLTLYQAGTTERGNVVSTFGLPVDSDDPFERDAGTEGFPFDPGEGVSFERLDPLTADGLGGWVRSVSSSGSTPGSVNSVTPVARDLALESLVATHLGAGAGEDLGIVAVVASAGTLGVDGGTLVLYRDADLDGAIGVDDEFLGSQDSLPAFEVGERIAFDFEGGLPDGRHRLLAELSPDDRPSNNLLAHDVSVGQVDITLVVNEFMNRPLEEAPEWIELYNASPEAVELSGWRLGDDFERALIAPWDPVRIPAGGFVVLTADADEMVAAWPLVSAPILEPESWESLLNSDDVISLANSDGFVVDRVPYDDAWRGNRESQAGISWERVDPMIDADRESNWWMSVNAAGATPGAENSLSGGFSAGISLEVAPDPFSPDGNGFQDITAIRYRLPSKSVLTLRVFDLAGRPRRTLVDGQGRADGVVVWDGTDDQGRILDVGMYVILAEARGETLVKAKRPVVVARPLR